jgi:hypothetical protein
MLPGHAREPQSLTPPEAAASSRETSEKRRAAENVLSDQAAVRDPLIRCRSAGVTFSAYEAYDTEEEGQEDKKEHQQERSVTTDCTTESEDEFLNKAEVVEFSHDVSRHISIFSHNRMQSILLPVIESDRFSIFSSLNVMSTCLQLGLDANFRMTEYFEPQYEEFYNNARFYMKCWQILNTLLFSSEMGIRIAAEQWDFLAGKGRCWNLFDLFLLVFSFLTLTINNNSLSILRVVRLVRMVRLFEVSPDLRLMTYSIAACAQSLVWAFILMFLIMWIFSCYFMEVAYIALQAGSMNDANKDIVQRWWNGMFLSVRSLVLTITGGWSWGELAAPFFAISPIQGSVYMVFVVAFMVGLLNILVGIFVQKSDDRASWDPDGVLIDAFENIRIESARLEDLFKEIDITNKGGVTLHDLIEGLKSPRIMAYFKYLHIDDMDPYLFFKKLDANHNGFVEVDEFTTGCLRMQGSAKPAEVLEILSLSRAIASKLDSLVPANDARSLTPRKVLD